MLPKSASNYFFFLFLTQCVIVLIFTVNLIVSGDPSYTSSWDMIISLIYNIYLHVLKVTGPIRKGTTALSSDSRYVKSWNVIILFISNYIYNQVNSKTCNPFISFELLQWIVMWSNPILDASKWRVSLSIIIDFSRRVTGICIDVCFGRATSGLIIYWLIMTVFLNPCFREAFGFSATATK
jgi:hypothetical protein